MEINLKQLSDQAMESTTDARKMKLSEDASVMVFQMFTKKVYSNPIGTVVREITSNSFDSHIEAGVNKPVVIRKHKDEQTGTHYISFIDYGVGMSPDRIYNIYGTYFESTKRMDNTQIGGFGIGGKTPLAYMRSTGQGENEYDNSFLIITVFNGIKYVYLISEGPDSPVINPLHNEPTTEGNGTEIQIPVLESDMDDFKAEMLRQLYYFDNIVFEGFEYIDRDSNEIINPLPNDYQIIRGKNFLFRGEDYSDYMHVCLGKVAYPIKYEILGLSSKDYNLPIALKLEVGDVNVSLSREELDYSKKAIQLLKKKLEEAKAEIIELIGKQYADIQTLEQYFAVKLDFGKLEFPNGMSLYVDNLIEQKDIDFSNFKYSFMKMPSDKKLFKFFFEPRMFGKKPSKSRYSSNASFEGGYESLKSKSNLLYIEDEFNRKVLKQAWLKQQHVTYYIISKRDISNKFMRSEIADVFNVHLDDTMTESGKPVKFVKSLLKMQEEYMAIVRKNCQDYDTLEIPEDFIASRKRGSGITPELRKLSIPVKFVGGYSKDRIKLSVLFDFNMPIFYGTADDEYALKNAVQLYSLLFDEESMVSHCSNDKELIARKRRHNDTPTKKGIAFIQVAQNNVKHMEHCKKAYHISEFKQRMSHRKEEAVRQYFQTYEVIKKYNELDMFYRQGYIDRVNQTWGQKLEAIRTYIDAIPAEAKNDNIRYNKNQLTLHYNLTDIKQTPEQLVILKQISEVTKLQETNEKILDFFRMPGDSEYMTDEQITILQVSLEL